MHRNVREKGEGWVAHGTGEDGMRLGEMSRGGRGDGGASERGRIDSWRLRGL